MKRLFLLLITGILCFSCEPSDPITDTGKTPEENPGGNPDDGTDVPGTGEEQQPGDQKPDDQLPETLIYYDNLDRQTGSDKYLDTWDGYINAEGWGAKDVSYTGRSISTGTRYVSTAYPGASGLNGFYCAANTTTLTISGIRIPPDGTGKYCFTAGINVYINGSNISPEGYVTMYINDGSASRSISYTAQKYSNWYLVSADFELIQPLPHSVSIILEFKAKGIRMDDPKLIWYGQTSDTGEEVAPKLTTPYFEYPQTLKENPDYVYGTLNGKTYRSAKQVRNYSYCYDVARHNPMWVAYPCHEIYWEGGYTRPNPDPWRPNPDLTDAQQSVIYASDWNQWPWLSTDRKPADNKHYWTYTTKNDVMLSKGHMMRSAERGAGVSNVLFGLNEQSFYPTNINPERDRYVQVTDGTGTFDLSHWSLVEYMLPNDWRCADTVYVVVGCWYDKDQYEAIDASYWGSRSSKTKVCKVPAARYKAVLRTKKGNTGKKLYECSADELMAIAFWFPQWLEPQNVMTEIEPLSTQTMSVADLEKKIGGDFNFFPDVPAAVKSSYNPSDWPGLAGVIDDPLNASFDLKQIK